MAGTVEQEAYLLGCLFGRGSIYQSQDGKNYDVILRLPYKEFSPVKVAIVSHLLSKNHDVDLPELQSLAQVRSAGIDGRSLGFILRTLSLWHPRNVMNTPKPIVKRKGLWGIKSKKMAKMFLEEQNLLHNRETDSLKFVLQHLADSAKYISNSPVTQPAEPYKFGIMNHIVVCQITPMIFETLKAKYGLEEGEIHLHYPVPRAVFQFSKDAIAEFIRGIADTIADFDKAWGQDNAWRVQFSILGPNEKLPIDICELLQSRLSVPIHYIDWAGGKRGSRDHLLKVNIRAFEKIEDLFYNQRKKLEFVEHLTDAKEGGIPDPTPCLGSTRKSSAKFIKKCRSKGCWRLYKNKKL
ncbi:MAG: hypothetical protein ABSB10_00775 [Candidatus Bathyarchaeia archaeon]